MRKINVEPANGRRRWKRVGLPAVGAIGLALATAGWLLMPAGSVHAAPSRPTTSSGHAAASSLANLLSTPALPDQCNPNWVGYGLPYPPGHDYRLGFVAAVGLPPNPAGQLVTGPISVKGITAKACGTATVTNGSRSPTNPNGCAVNANISVPPTGQLFGNLVAAINIIPGITPKIPFTPNAQSLTTSLGCGSSVGGLQVTASATVGGSAGLFGLNCGVTLTIPLKATINGPLDSPGLGLTGTFQPSEPFEIPAVTTSSVSCPAGVVKVLNQVVGLPLIVAPYPCQWPPDPSDSKAPCQAALEQVLNLPFSSAAYVPPSS